MKQLKSHVRHDDPEISVNFTYSRAPFVFCNLFNCFTDVAVVVSRPGAKSPLQTRCDAGWPWLSGKSILMAVALLLFCSPVYPGGLRFPSSTASAVWSWQSTQTSGCLLRALPIPPIEPSWGFTTCQAFWSGLSPTANGLSAPMVWPRARMAGFICWTVRWTCRRVCWFLTSTCHWREASRCGQISKSPP